MRKNEPLHGAPGWYKSSTNPEIERYWNGSSWTDQVRISARDAQNTKNLPPVSEARESSLARSQKSSIFTPDRIGFAITTAVVIIAFAILVQFVNQSNANVDPSLSAGVTPQPTRSDSPAPEPVFEETPNLSDLTTCKIEDQRLNKTQPNNVGFPLTPDIIPAQGTADIVVIAVDFIDAPGEGSPAEFLNTQISKIQEWYKTTSEGKLSINFQTSPDWIHVPVASASFNISPEVANGPNEFRVIQQAMAQEIINATGNQFDWSNVDGVLFQFPATIQGVEKDLGDRGVSISTPQGGKNLFFWGGGRYHHIDSGSLTATVKQELTWAFWIHEMLHSQGLALHSPGNGIQTSLANNQYGTSLVLDAWETFLLGWLPDEKVFCATKDQISVANIKLTPLETTIPGKRIGIIRLSDSEALIIESRRATGYSQSWPKDHNGLLVYRINTTLDNDRSQECCGDLGNDPIFSKWGYYIVPEGNTVDTTQGPNLQHLQLLAKQGDKVIYDGLVIELIYSGQQDFVKITKQ